MPKMKKWGKLLAVLLLAAAAGCAAEPARPTHCELAAKDSGRQLRLFPGDTFSVELESNPTTGYRWQLVDAGKPGVLAAAGDEFIAPSTGLCGAPGRRKLSFRAAAPGETALQLVYVRPWEKGTPPVRRFRVTVVVERR